MSLCCPGVRPMAAALTSAEINNPLAFEQ